MKTCQHHVSRWRSGMDADLVRCAIGFLKELNLLLCWLATSKTLMPLTAHKTIGGGQFGLDWVKYIKSELKLEPSGASSFSGQLLSQHLSQCWHSPVLSRICKYQRQNPDTKLASHLGYLLDFSLATKQSWIWHTYFSPILKLFAKSKLPLLWK